jgi:hypothetical protein
LTPCMNELLLNFWYGLEDFWSRWCEQYNVNLFFHEPVM